MPGKPYQSKLSPFHVQVLAWREEGVSYRTIADRLRQDHGLEVTHNAVYSYLNAKSRRHLTRQLFTHGLDADLREALLKQLTALWTHDSTALEGNTLSLGETVKVLEMGLTISGKSLREHEEVYGHARAIDLLREMMDIEALDDTQLFALHQAVMPKSPVDAQKPIGAWKRVYNGATGLADGQMTYLEYSAPDDVPALMDDWLQGYNKRLDEADSPEQAIEHYAWAHLSFVRIHPFFDGNGRLARLLANLPVLRGGWPPIVIRSASRSRYIDLLWRYQVSHGTLIKGQELLPDDATVDGFRELLREEWRSVQELVESFRARQASRR